VPLRKVHKMQPLEKTYQPKEIESNIYFQWETSGKFTPSFTGKPYSIVLPPPNITGSLHMGHGFQQTIMDALVRYHRMLGENVLWQTGVDHAGIATQMVVENQLAVQQKTRHDLGREKFVEKIWEWKEESGNTITQQMRRLGTSMDWSRERFTMDPHFSETVTDVFVRLYDEKLIYKGQRLVNWDPYFKTAISDLEVISEEENGFLWYIRYPLTDSADHLIVATTRPETMLGDVAVAVHPDDVRYQKFIGKKIKLPLSNREIIIIADTTVDPEFGTGCVKITPAHDFNDYEMGKRHQLPMINIFTDSAHINENAPKSYQGLERFVARKKIIEDLKTIDLLEKIEPHKLKVPRNDRGQNIIEPYLTYQWYVHAKPLAEVAIDAVKKGKTKFVPENWSKTYFDWLENIQDWCISRQLWWGHRVPAWYDESGKVYVAHTETEVRKKYQLTDAVNLTQDNDVLDTWFSAALWPFVTLGWPNETAELKAFYPSAVLVTGFDIIFFWVARMMMLGLKFMGDVPFREVYITGLIRDAQGQKMSKTKGNVLDPIDLIDGISLEALVEKRTKSLMQTSMKEKIEQTTRKEFPDGIAAYGTDALRFTYCALASHGRDIRFDIARLEGYRNFCNKLWNATRYVLMNIETYYDPNYPEITVIENSIDQWIYTKLQETIQKAHEYFAQYRFDLLSKTLYDFAWHEYCDWYLELAKPLLLSEDSTSAQKQGVIQTLIKVLDTILRLLHPIMPFITEHLWQHLKIVTKTTVETMMLESYPQVNEALKYPAALADIEWVKSFILAIRNIRGEMNIAPGKLLSVNLLKGSSFDKARLKIYELFLIKLAKLSTLEQVTIAPSSAVTALLGELEIFIPMSDFINKEEEIARLNREIDKQTIELNRLEEKLTNPQFVHKAPAVLVEKEKMKLQEIRIFLQKMEEQLRILS
jgi:valyl-tRNA synthetase